MPKMVPFVGQRLRRARTARMMTGVSLAEAVGVTPAAITRFEKGDAEPREEIMRRLAEVLRVPVAHFLNPLLPDPGFAVRMRSMSAATKRARDSAGVRVDWLREIVLYVSALMPLPDVDVPDLYPGRDPAALSYMEIEDLAVALRRAWGMRDGPVANLTELLESKGFIVSCFSLGADTLDAFGKWAPDSPIIVENTDRSTSSRMRFDLGHELGHMLLHRHVPDALAARSEIHKLMERQAHRFAAAFLFPARSFANEIYSVTIESLLEPKRRWKVSIQTMIRRAFDLQLITQDQYERAFRNVSMQGFRKREPLDADLTSEAPTQIARRIGMLLDERGFTVDDIETHTRQGRREIESLCALPPGSLDTTSPPSSNGKVVRLRQRAS